MMKSKHRKEDELLAGFRTAAINSVNRSYVAYRRESLSNNHTKERKILSSIEQELASCNEFKIRYLTAKSTVPERLKLI